ncbi:hypothetical protein ACOCJ4_02570 [Knoellia sp. CPCC 206435]|uniref:hypothetical protein n=1 Tax=Knoellia terrae TaxID=3404797 RepID=UPI003B43D193
MSEIRVYCDDSSHAGRTVTVGKFTEAAWGDHVSQWVENSWAWDWESRAQTARGRRSRAQWREAFKAEHGRLPKLADLLTPGRAGELNNPDDWRSGGDHVLIGPDGTPVDVDDADFGDGWRVKYIVACELCAPVNYKWRAERVGPLLFKLADAGVSAVRLSDLAARL